MTACARCGRDPAEGFAQIGDENGVDRYCHATTRPSCYEAEVAERAMARFLDHENYSL